MGCQTSWDVMAAQRLQNKPPAPPWGELQINGGRWLDRVSGSSHPLHHPMSEWPPSALRQLQAPANPSKAKACSPASGPAWHQAWQRLHALTLEVCSPLPEGWRRLLGRVMRVDAGPEGQCALRVGARAPPWCHGGRPQGCLLCVAWCRSHGLGPAWAQRGPAPRPPAPGTRRAQAHPGRHPAGSAAGSSGRHSQHAGNKPSPIATATA